MKRIVAPLLAALLASATAANTQGGGTGGSAPIVHSDAGELRISRNNDSR